MPKLTEMTAANATSFGLGNGVVFVHGRYDLRGPSDLALCVAEVEPVFVHVQDKSERLKEAPALGYRGREHFGKKHLV